MTIKDIDFENISEEKSVLLQCTTEVTEDLLEVNPDPWKGICAQYKKTSERPIVIKSLVSIMNSIFTHRRVIFCLSRESLRKLLKSDKNWRDYNKRVSLKNDNYKIILKLLYVNNVVKEVDQKNRNIMIFEVVHPDILESLNPSMTKDKQLEQCLDFASDKKGFKGFGKINKKKNSKKTEENVDKPHTREWKKMVEKAKNKKMRGSNG